MPPLLIGVRLSTGLLAALLAAGALLGCGGHRAAPPRPGPGCERIDPSVACSVLFIGNSYTAVNDLPATLTKLAASGGIAVSTRALDPGGATLADHLAAPETAAALEGSTWNVVVLQDQSQIPSVERFRQVEMYPATRELVRQVRQVQAEPLLFETWAHSHGWPENGLVGYDRMQAAINQGYQTIAGELQVPISPVGSAWSQALRRPAHSGLWAEDGSHPSADGTYLAACVMYAAIFRRAPVGLSYDADLPAREAAGLQAVAANAVLARPAVG